MSKRDLCMSCPATGVATRNGCPAQHEAFARGEDTVSECEWYDLMKAVAAGGKASGTNGVSDRRNRKR